MAGARRNPGPVVARSTVRTLAAAGVVQALGGLGMVGCMWRWAAVDGAPVSLTQWFVMAVGGAMALAGVLFLTAGLWAA